MANREVIAAPFLSVTRIVARKRKKPGSWRRVGLRMSGLFSIELITLPNVGTWSAWSSNGTWSSQRISRPLAELVPSVPPGPGRPVPERASSEPASVPERADIPQVRTAELASLAAWACAVVGPAAQPSTARSQFDGDESACKNFASGRGSHDAAHAHDTARGPAAEAVGTEPVANTEPAGTCSRVAWCRSANTPADSCGTHRSPACWCRTSAPGSSGNRSLHGE